MYNELYSSDEEYKVLAEDRERRLRQQQENGRMWTKRGQQMTGLSNNMAAVARTWIASWQAARFRRRLRRKVVCAEAHFAKSHPQWRELLFDRVFLLNQGLPIIERHFAAASGSDGMELALAWCEQWPQMAFEKRKAYLKLLTPCAAEFLRMVATELMKPHSLTSEASDFPRRRIGAPVNYVQSTC